VKRGDVRNPNYHKKIKKRSEKEIEKRTKI
jgi:hypothetical protein